MRWHRLSLTCAATIATFSLLLLGMVPRVVGAQDRNLSTAGSPCWRASPSHPRGSPKCRPVLAAYGRTPARLPLRPPITKFAAEEVVVEGAAFDTAIQAGDNKPSA
jgi:hypothetical protein